MGTSSSFLYNTYTMNPLTCNVLAKIISFLEAQVLHSTDNKF